MAKFDEEEWKKRMAREAAEEEARERDLNDQQVDDSLMFETFEVLGLRASEVAKFQKEAEEALKDRIDMDDAMRVIEKGKKLHKKGKKAEAEKLLKGNKNVQKISKAQQKKKGCGVIAILLLAIGGTAAGSVVWGAVEVISALH